MNFMDYAAVGSDSGLWRSIQSVLGSLVGSDLDNGVAFHKPVAAQSIEQVAGRLWERIRRHVSTGAHPRLTDVQGRPLTAEELPLTGDHLTPAVALAILERLEERIEAHPSAGQLAACLLEHVRYGIGNADRLSPTQVRFVKSVCTLTNRRPLPFLRFKEFILRNLDAPETLRKLLTIMLEDQDRYLDELQSAVGRQIGTLGLPAVPRIAVFGYASTLSVVLAEIAKASSGKMRLYIANVPRAGRNPAPEKALRLALKKFDVDYERDESGLREALATPDRFDLVLAGTKVVSKSASGSLEVIHSAPCVEFLSEIRRNSPRTKIALATALFKIWPASFYARHRELALRLELSGATLANSSISEEEADIILSELGCLSPRDFREHWKVVRLLGREDILSFAEVLATRGENADAALLSGAEESGDLAQPSAALILQSRAAQSAVLEPRRLESEAEAGEYARAAELFKERCADPAWLSAHKGQFIAIRGTEPPTVILGKDYIAVMMEASATWPNAPIFASRI